jgi:OOP family OmpA-OmpF porin
VVKEGDKELVLDQPYAAAKITPLRPSAYRASPQEVEAQFGAALAAQPARATAFTLYFIQGSDELTDESKQDVDRILAEIARRPVPDVLVVGHTDAVGNDTSNDALGQQRADSMRAALIGRGLAPENVRAISRGKRAPAVPTADGVAEPRNRRVEILVR